MSLRGIELNKELKITEKMTVVYSYVKETEKAKLFNVRFNKNGKITDKDLWIPKSSIIAETENAIVIQSWVRLNNNLECTVKVESIEEYLKIDSFLDESVIIEKRGQFTAKGLEYEFSAATKEEVIEYILTQIYEEQAYIENNYVFVK